MIIIHQNNKNENKKTCELLKINPIVSFWLLLWALINNKYYEDEDEDEDELKKQIHKWTAIPQWSQFLSMTMTFNIYILKWLQYLDGQQTDTDNDQTMKQKIKSNFQLVLPCLIFSFILITIYYMLYIFLADSIFIDSVFLNGFRYSFFYYYFLFHLFFKVPHKYHLL